MTTEKSETLKKDCPNKGLSTFLDLKFEFCINFKNFCYFRALKFWKTFGCTMVFGWIMFRWLQRSQKHWKKIELIRACLHFQTLKFEFCINFNTFFYFRAQLFWDTFGCTMIFLSESSCDLWLVATLRIHPKEEQYIMIHC